MLMKLLQNNAKVVFDPSFGAGLRGKNRVKKLYFKIMVLAFYEKSDSRKIQVLLISWISVYCCHGNIDYPRNTLYQKY